MALDPSLGNLKQLALDLRCISEADTRLAAAITRVANLALDDFASDLPEAFEGEEHIVLYPDVVSTDTVVAARLSTTTDPWVLEFVDSVGTGIDMVGSMTLWRPTLSGLWDGKMHLEVTPPGATEPLRRQSLEWFRVENPPGGGRYHYYVTLERPWRNLNDVLMNFRIHQPEFFLPDHVTHIKQPLRVWDSSRQLIWGVDNGAFHRFELDDFRGQSTGIPKRFTRGRLFQMPTPTRVPDATVGAIGWVGPVQEGIFTFCYTYAWGVKDEEWQTSPGGNPDPMWESAPSPVSVVDATKILLGGPWTITTSEIDAVRGFDVAGSLRETHGGWKVRIYVARTSVRLAGAGLYNSVETDGRYYFLAEIDTANTVPAATYVWDGSVIPDYHRPLRRGGGTHAWLCTPHQDKRYELDVSVKYIPRAFVDDADVAPIRIDAVPLFFKLFMKHACLLDGVDEPGALRHEKEYLRKLPQTRDALANPSRVVEPKPFMTDEHRTRFTRYRDV